MQINLVNGSLKFQGTLKSFLLNPTKKNEKEGDVLVALNTFDKDIVGNYIYKAGEYENSEVLLNLYKIDAKYKADVNYALITFEGIHVLWLSGEVTDLPKEMVENLPDIHFFIFTPGDPKSIEKRVDLVSEIEPAYLVLQDHDKTSLFDFEKQYGEQSEVTKKIKVKAEEFENVEEVNTKLIRFE